MYDFDNDNLITQEEVRLLLSYAPLETFTVSYARNCSRRRSRAMKNPPARSKNRFLWIRRVDYNDRVEAQAEIEEIVKLLF